MPDHREAEILAYIRKRLRRIENEKSSKLPSEHELASRFSVPRMTIRGAYLKLEDMGLVYSQQGKGRFAALPRKTIELSLSGETSFTDKMRESGIALETRLVACGFVKMKPRVWSALGATLEDRVFRLGRLRIVDGMAVAIHFSYLKIADFPDLLLRSQSFPSIFAYFREKGFCRFTSSGATLGVKFPSDKEARFLQVGHFVPLLSCESDTLDEESGKVLQFSRILYRGDAFLYRI
ncbi:MAG: GntR family transcriptional regulator [Treponema sp.]|nr:GntR family transcriptional regulator [Treponema sp.]